MVEHRIPTTTVGTGLTSIYSVTPGRTARIEQVSFTNTAGASRTIHVYDGSGITEVCKFVIGGTESFIPAEILGREIRLDQITTVCDEGTEVTVSGYLTEV